MSYHPAASMQQEENPGTTRRQKMEQAKVTTILREEAGLTNTEIDALTQEAVESLLLKLGYDIHGEKLPQGQTAGNRGTARRTTVRRLDF